MVLIIIIIVNWAECKLSSSVCLYIYTLRLQLIAGTNFSVFALRVFGIIIQILAILKCSIN